MKKWTKILCVICLCVFLLAGCGGLSNIKNTESEILYNGNSAVLVGDNIFFGNSFADYTTFEGKSDYNASAKVSYLSRLDLSNLEAKNKDYSPKNVKKIAGQVTSHAKSFMFVLGNYIYYLTPYTEKAENEDGEYANYYNYSTIYKCKLNGDDRKKLYNTNGEISKIEVLKFDDRYYIVMLIDQKLIKINLKNEKITEIAREVESFAIPSTYQQDKLGSTLNWNGYIFYTTASKDVNGNDTSNSKVMRVSISGGDAENVYPNMTGKISFVARERDVVFYTKDSELYMSDMTNKTEKNAFSSNIKKIYTPSDSVSNFNGVYSQGASVGSEILSGYLFLDDGTLMFINKDGNSLKTITLKDSEGNEISSYSLMVVNGGWAYVSTSSNIYQVNLSNILTSDELSCRTIVSMTGIHSGNMYAFSKKYVYFYATLQTPQTNEDDTETAPTDSYEYFYRARIDGDNDYELLSLTDVAGRHS